MMQVLPKWNVTIHRGVGTAPIVFYVSDNFLSNVLRKLGDRSFEPEPHELVVTLATGVGS